MTFSNQLESLKSSSKILAEAGTKTKNKFLEIFALLLKRNIKEISAANNLDLKKLGAGDKVHDRLLFSKERILLTISDIKNVIKLSDPVGEIIETKKMQNGLKIQKKRVPFGVIGIIYEARPNVTCDAISLCAKSGNAVLLRGSKSAYNTNLEIVNLAKKAAKNAGLPRGIFEIINPFKNDLVLKMLKADNFIDLIIPRGGAQLIKFVKKNSVIPIIETGAGVCHTYIDRKADTKKAISIVHNAKTNRPSICNALDTLLVHKNLSANFWQKLSDRMMEAEVEIRADEQSYNILKKCGYSQLKKAKKSDFGKEFLSLIMSVRIVNNIDEALSHIEKYGSKHSECIVTEDKILSQKFLDKIDAAAVYVNASTRFTDGAQFGLGAEMGISTQKMHARGPFALNELATYKWLIYGDGQIRK